MRIILHIIALMLTALLAIALFYVSRFWSPAYWGITLLGQEGLLGVEAINPGGNTLNREILTRHRNEEGEDIVDLRPYRPFAILIWGLAAIWLLSSLHWIGRKLRLLGRLIGSAKVSVG